MLHYPKTKSINQTISDIIEQKNVYFENKKKKKIMNYEQIISSDSRSNSVCP
jgi:hypothetical protein